MIAMTGQPTMSTWYAVPADGGKEYPFTDPFQAHTKLNALGVEGNIELWSARTGLRDIETHRDADGTWSIPEH
jgi:hypothetical protein